MLQRLQIALVGGRGLFEIEEDSGRAQTAQRQPVFVQTRDQLQHFCDAALNLRSHTFERLEELQVVEVEVGRRVGDDDDVRHDEEEKHVARRQIPHVRPNRQEALTIELVVKTG